MLHQATEVSAHTLIEVQFGIAPPLSLLHLSEWNMIKGVTKKEMTNVKLKNRIVNCEGKHKSISSKQEELYQHILS